MNFQTLQKVESAQTYLDIALRHGRDAAARQKSTKAHKKGNVARVDKVKNVMLAHVEGTRNSMKMQLERILRSFPVLSSLPTFYYELTRTALDYYLFKNSLGTVNWGRNKIEDLYQEYKEKLRHAKDITRADQFRREFIGRTSSVFYQMEKAFKFLEQARKTMKEFPTIKTETKTIVIAGFPNVGKTTLLSKMTGSKPEIAGYAFTTKTINTAYYKHNNEKIQVLDTPGTLNRFEKMNMIEKQAYLAMKLCADVFVYVFDLTEPFPIEDQEKMLKIVKGFDKKLIIYLSKSDIIDKEVIEKFAKKHNAIYDIDELKAKISEEIANLEY